MLWRRNIEMKGGGVKVDTNPEELVNFIGDVPKQETLALVSIEPAVLCDLGH